MKNPQKLGYHLLSAAGIEVGGPNPWDIHIHNEQLFERVMRNRELALGEAYQDGWWDAERVDLFLVKLLLADLSSKISPSFSSILLAAKAQIFNRQSKRRAKRNANAHYNIGNDLYERMLDSRMIYSCAYWSGVETLDAAQEAKLNLICQKLQLEPGMTLLDIGCGWGGFADFAATNYGVSVTAISPAIEQVRVAKKRCTSSNVTVEQLDYRNVEGTFDRIVSIGMMEHVGAKNLRTFFETCDDHLRTDGLMLHQTIGSNESKNRTDPWFDKYIFPGGVVPSLEQIAQASLKKWVIEDLHNFGSDYDRTLLEWSKRIETRWAEIPHYDERFRRTWNYYLMTSAASFRVRNLQLWQIVFRKPNQITGVYETVR